MPLADRVKDYFWVLTRTRSRDSLYVAKKLADRLTEIYTHPPIPVLEIAERDGVRVTFHAYPPNVRH